VNPKVRTSMRVTQTVRGQLQRYIKENTEKRDQCGNRDEKPPKHLGINGLVASFQIVADRLEQVYRSMANLRSRASAISRDG